MSVNSPMALVMPVLRSVSRNTELKIDFDFENFSHWKIICLTFNVRREFKFFN